MKAIFGQKVIQVVARDAARDVGKSLADEIGVLCRNVFQSVVDLSAASRFGDDALQIFGGGGADAQAHAVRCDNVEFFDVVVGLARHYRMDSAGIVSDHPADGATIVAGGIGREGEVMLFGGGAGLIEDNAGPPTNDAACRVDRKNY